MGSSTLHMDVELVNWQQISNQFERGGLLVGNGASLAIWERFNYRSLYEMAQSSLIEHQLTIADLDVFHGLHDTENFETALRALWIAKLVNEALNADALAIVQRYEHIQTALIEAVKAVHIPHTLLDSEEAPLAKIRTELANYKYVYSTNYDLLLYWAFMTNPKGFIDYFWSGTNNHFSPLDARDPKEDETAILYVHGALHLMRLFSEETRKIVADGDRTLLDILSAELPEGATRLFVTEGNASGKIAAIQSSHYLSFAYSRLVQHSGPLVIFGHSLSEEEDDHLVQAMRQKPHPDRLAISLLDHGNKLLLQERVASLRRRLSREDIEFFDAKTHPLGNSQLKVEVP